MNKVTGVAPASGSHNFQLPVCNFKEQIKRVGDFDRSACWNHVWNMCHISNVYKLIRPPSALRIKQKKGENRKYSRNKKGKRKMHIILEKENISALLFSDEFNSNIFYPSFNCDSMCSLCLVSYLLHFLPITSFTRIYLLS